MLATAGIVLMTGRFAWSTGGLSWQIAWMIPVLILAALKEEVVFRGYIVRIFWDDQQPLRGVLVSSILFWITHMPFPTYGWV